MQRVARAPQALALSLDPINVYIPRLLLRLAEGQHEAPVEERGDDHGDARDDDVADEGGKDARHENIFHEVPVQQHVDDETIPDVHGSSPHFSDEVSLGQFQT